MVEEGLCCSASPKREGRNTQQTATCSLRDVSVHTAAPQFWLWHQHHISLYFWFYFFLPFWLFSIAYWSFLITCHANFLDEVVKGCKYYYFSVVWCIMWMEMALTLKDLHSRLQLKISIVLKCDFWTHWCCYILWKLMLEFLKLSVVSRLQHGFIKETHVVSFFPKVEGCSQATFLIHVQYRIWRKSVLPQSPLL